MELLILGAGGHGRTVGEVAEEMGCYQKIAFLDDSYDGTKPSIVGKLADVQEMLPFYSHVFVAIGDSGLRREWQEKLKGCQIPVLIHPDAWVAPSATIGEGTVIMPKAVVQTNAAIGVGCILSAGAIIDHDAVIGDYCHINAGAIVPSMCEVPCNTKLDYGSIASKRMG